ncbi:hypothetical protein PO883_05715 [Massilia sp. DJPM01]|uniref:hypothetical protein n=1 Tax=Massilia sp. DJPM01 TaxID=3024404 RepID=UPI00259FA14A|nr:hypothetical protein [Massilia sp. DJPM01]MDM5176691.1 hypothetical protein [Massilia sp. DJPM01]
MKPFFGHDPLGGLLYYGAVTLVLWFCIRRAARGRTGALARALATAGMLGAPFAAYWLVNIDRLYGQWRYVRPACRADGGDQIARHLDRLDSLAVHPAGIGGSGDIVDIAATYTANHVGKQLAYVEFQFDSASVAAAVDGGPFRGRNAPQPLTLDGQPAAPGYYRVDNLCSAAPGPVLPLPRACFRARRIDAFTSAYLLEHRMEPCTAPGGSMRLCAMRWTMTERATGALVARAVTYAYVGGWRNRAAFPDAPAPYDSNTPYDFCGSRFASGAQGLIEAILTSKGRQ